MRDPKRIDKIIKKLQELWKRHPDWRFTQLLLNIVEIKSPALFYMEDEQLLEKIEEMMSNERR